LWHGFPISSASGRGGEIKDQLDRASISNVLNIAEGNGKYSRKDRCRFLDAANASALECAAGLDILVAKKKLAFDDIRSGKESLQKIVRMLIGLIKRSETRDYPKSHDPEAAFAPKSYSYSCSYSYSHFILA
jgi:four helix bundle protein